MQRNALQNISLNIPVSDIGLLKDIASRLGWSIELPTRKNELDEALGEAERGEVTAHKSVDGYFKDILR